MLIKSIVYYICSLTILHFATVMPHKLDNKSNSKGQNYDYFVCTTKYMYHN